MDKKDNKAKKDSKKKKIEIKTIVNNKNNINKLIIFDIKKNECSLIEKAIDKNYFDFQTDIP